MQTLFFGNQNNPHSKSWLELKPKSKQVHGFRCVEVTEVNQDCGEVDALWTRVKNIPIGVMTADCVPLLLYYSKDAEVKAVGAIHAGWRGTFSHIVEHFFNSLPDDIADPEHWFATLGPSIRSECYEVSPELIEEFVDEFPYIPRGVIEPETRHLDLIAINVSELKRMGVEHIDVRPDCTFCCENPQYFSYRRGDRNGRQYSIISF